MKIRQGFISNSSSTSFIIAVKKDFEQELVDLINEQSEQDGENSIFMKNRQECLEYIIKEIVWKTKNIREPKPVSGIQDGVNLFNNELCYKAFKRDISELKTLETEISLLGDEWEIKNIDQSYGDKIIGEYMYKLQDDGNLKILMVGYE